MCMWASNRCLPATVKAFGVRPSILEWEKPRAFGTDFFLT